MKILGKLQYDTFGNRWKLKKLWLFIVRKNLSQRGWGAGWLGILPYNNKAESTYISSSTISSTKNPGKALHTDSNILLQSTIFSTSKSSFPRLQVIQTASIKNTYWLWNINNTATHIFLEKWDTVWWPHT